MPAAVVGGVIAGAGAIGGAALSAKAQKKAAKSAAQAQLDATAQNNALAREQYAKNEAALAPWQQRGNAAGAAMNALLGLAGPAPTVATPSGGNALLPQSYNNQAGRFARQPFGAGEASYNDPTDSYVSTQAMPQTTASPQSSLDSYKNAFDNYRNSTGYTFRLGEGIRARDASASAAGVRNSGAALKSLERFGQNIASDEFGNYLNQLFGVSNQGLSAANAQAGVGTTLVNALTNNNNNAADAISNSALLRGQANANLYAGIGGALGNLGGLFGSSFGSSSGGLGSGNGAFGIKTVYKN